MAVPDIDFRIEGLRAVEDNLVALGNQYGPRNAIAALRQPIRNILAPLRDQIRSSTPVDSGTLAESTGISIRVPSRRDRRNPEVRDTVVVGNVGWIWRTPSMKLLRRAFAVEYGGPGRAPTRILRDAFDELERSVRTNFAQTLARNVEQTATRLSKRQAAGTLRREIIDGLTSLRRH